MKPGPSCTVRWSSGQTGAQRFAEPGYGYTIEYPNAWEMSKPASMATMFSGREGTPDYAAIVRIQNIAPLGAKSPSDAAKRALNQFRGRWVTLFAISQS